MEKVFEWLDSVVNFFTLFLGSVICGASYLVGGIDILVELLAVAMALDFFTGFLKGVKCKTLSSKTARDGMFKKIGVFVFLAAAVVLDKLLGYHGHKAYFRSFIASVFIAIELISLAENVEILGVKLPRKMRDVLIQIKNKGFLNDEEKKE